MPFYFFFTFHFSFIFGFSVRRLLIIASLALITIGCERLLSTKKGHLKPLAQFKGLTIQKNDSIISGEKWQGFVNPKIAVVWQMVGGPLNQYAITNEGSVNVKAPFNFQGTLMNPLPNQMINSKQPAIGSIWLYNDGNNNGKLDNLYHPDHLKRIHKQDSLHSDFNNLYASYMQTISFRSQKTNTTESFYLDTAGVIYLKNAGKYRPYFDPKQWGLPPQISRELLLERRYFLTAPNKWERFFNSRHRFTLEMRHDEKKIDEQYSQFNLYYKRRIFPMENAQAEFEKATIKLILQKLNLDQYAYTTYLTSNKKKWLDHPFQYRKRGDWVIGRSTNYHVTYFGTQQEIKNLFEAEKSSAFEFSNLSKVHLGYNFLYCDDQYKCRLLEDEEIHVLIGPNFNYFQPKEAAVPIKPSPFPQIDTSAVDTSLYEGVYELSTYLEIKMIKRGRSYWMKFPDRSYYQLLPVKEGLYYSPIYGTQVSFIKNDSSHLVTKIIVYDKELKNPAKRLETQIDALANNKIDSLESRSLVKAKSNSLTNNLGTYILGNDTLYLTKTKTNQLEVTLPELNTFLVYQENSRYSNPELEFWFELKKDSTNYYLTLNKDSQTQQFQKLN